MRMDNETYRLKVEGLLGYLRQQGFEAAADACAELEALALMPRKARYFLKALVATQQPREIHAHFLRYVMENARTQDVYADLERHIRHLFYENREEAQALVAESLSEAAMPALFQVISLTEESWLAGALMRIVLAAPVEQLRGPLVAALEATDDYLLQCLGIYLIGKTGDDVLLDELARFYRKPEGEKVDRLERKAFDALKQGGEACSPELIIRWLKDRHARIRELALTILEGRRLPETIVHVVSLVLIDPRTRTHAAEVLIQFTDARIFRWDDPENPHVAEVAKLIRSAKREPLVATLRGLMREESPAVREVGIELVRFLERPEEELLGQVRRLGIEDAVPSVQMAALRLLAEKDVDLLVPTLVEVFCDHGFGQGSQELLNQCNEIMARVLTPSQVLQVQDGIREKRERRDAALERFAGSVEWWRHDL